MPRRVLLLATAHTYRSEAFLKAAAQLGIEAIVASDMPSELAALWEQRHALDFSDIEAATARIAALHKAQPLAAVLAVDDSGSLLAARASAALGIAHNAPAAAEAARDKYLMRSLFARAGVASPPFRLCSTAEDPAVIAQQVSFPCVVKPLRLNGSRGVMRANDAHELATAIKRLSKLLDSLDPTPGPKSFLVEDFIPGVEVALEGMLDNGKLQVLALFDKPDPLDGPFFEETIYVTPSRLADDVQAAIARCAEESAAAVGLQVGPLHAELRVNERGPWIVELAGRSIGGLCSRTLRFGTDASLEELILRQACSLPIASFDRETQAGGVMMMPIPGEGILKGVSGVEAAAAVHGVEEVQITARLNYPLVPLPEGDSYLGFILACGSTPAEVEAALREAHAKIMFTVVPNIALRL